MSYKTGVDCLRPLKFVLSLFRRVLNGKPVPLQALALKCGYFETPKMFRWREDWVAYSRAGYGERALLIIDCYTQRANWLEYFRGSKARDCARVGLYVQRAWMFERIGKLELARSSLDAAYNCSHVCLPDELRIELMRELNSI
jgi:hypothetical protein